MTNSIPPQPHPLIEKLLKEMAGPRTFRTTYRMFHGPAGSEEPHSIPMFLELDKEELSPTSLEALDALEASATPGDAWTDFKWKLTAIDSVQDIFDPVFFVTDNDALLMMQQFYFYYESQQLLRESILCGLNGFTNAANVLLRPFLEFTLLQNYFIRSNRSAGSFAPLRKYFSTGIAPKASTILKRALPADDFVKPIRTRVQEHLAALSESTVHPYHPVFSANQHKTTAHGHSFESLHFWYMTGLIVEAAIWIYCANYPMLLHPVDVVRRFGCTGPVGVFINEAESLAIRHSLGKDYAEFRTWAASQPSVAAHLEYYNSRLELTDTEIIESCAEADDPSDSGPIDRAYARSVAQARASKAALAGTASLMMHHRADVRFKDVTSLAAWKRFGTKPKR